MKTPTVRQALARLERLLEEAAPAAQLSRLSTAKPKPNQSGLRAPAVLDAAANALNARRKAIAELEKQTDGEPKKLVPDTLTPKPPTAQQTDDVTKADALLNKQLQTAHVSAQQFKASIDQIAQRAPKGEGKGRYVVNATRGTLDFKQGLN